MAHKILIAIYYVLSSETPYQELGADYLERLEPERLMRNLVRRLERLGYQVNLEPPRESRRQISLSHAAAADSSSW